MRICGEWVMAVGFRSLTVGNFGLDQLRELAAVLGELGKDRLHPGTAASGPPTAPALAHLLNALVAAQGVEPLLVPAGFGSLPNYVFTKILGIPAFGTPYANTDEANHAPNENLMLDCFHSGIRTGAAVLHELGA